MFTDFTFVTYAVVTMLLCCSITFFCSLISLSYPLLPRLCLPPHTLFLSVLCLFGSMNSFCHQEHVHIPNPLFWPGRDVCNILVCSQVLQQDK
uniref:Uncharacterized protein n=1 Tax=Rhizophora mucronata TaxID=61149 RepID=A0A2P2JZS3_RHIMU